MYKHTEASVVKNSDQDAPYVRSQQDGSSANVRSQQAQGGAVQTQDTYVSFAPDASGESAGSGLGSNISGQVRNTASHIAISVLRKTTSSDPTIGTGQKAVMSVLETSAMLASFDSNTLRDPRLEAVLLRRVGSTDDYVEAMRRLDGRVAKYSAEHYGSIEEYASEIIDSSNGVTYNDGVTFIASNMRQAAQDGRIGGEKERSLLRAHNVR